MKYRLTPSRKALGLLIYFIITAMIPNFVLAKTEMYGGWSVAAGILLPLGFYMITGSMIRRTGVPVLLMIWVMILCSFQIVLLYMFGNSIIATDMFINLLTTNPGEATELLSNIAPAVSTVVAIYGPILIYAIFAAHRRYRITRKMRRIFIYAGISVSGLGIIALIPAHSSGGGSVFLKEVFPANVLYNLKLCLSEQQRIKNYAETSKDFNYNAVRTDNPKRREIYVYMIGEASRAADWEIYGYYRPTNPRLKKRDDIVVFHNVMTQSNTTHKSVPLFLSSVGATNRAELYNRKGLAELFAETGFKTYFISNQSPQGAMVDLLANEADERIYIGAPRYDMQLLSMMRRIIESDTDADMLFILHCYGSHFSYHQRYPREFARFVPDDDVSISKKNRQLLINAYDNSILYTDTVIDEINRLSRFARRMRIAALLFGPRRGHSRRQTRTVPARLTYGYILSVAYSEPRMVLGLLRRTLSAKSQCRRLQRMGCRDDAFDVPHDSRYGVDKEQVCGRQRFTGKRQFRQNRTAILPE